MQTVAIIYNTPAQFADAIGNGSLEYGNFYQVGDTRLCIATSGSTYVEFSTAGAIAKGASTLTIPANTKGQYTTFVSAAAVAVTSSIQAWAVPNEDWDLDELEEFSIATEAQAGGFDVCISYPGPFPGLLKINFIAN